MGRFFVDSYDDETTELVLDIVRKVLEPTIKDVPQHRECYINANINYFHLASVNIKYTKWSTNDSSGNVSLRQPMTTAAYTHEKYTVNTTKSNRMQPDFWSQYSGEERSDECGDSNKKSVSNEEYFNNNRKKFAWKDNADNMITRNFFYQHQLQQKQQKVMDNNFYPMKKNVRKYCSFCKKNGESYEFYTSHSLYENGKPACSILKQCVCSICRQSGHTMSHCNLNASKNSILKMIHRFNAMK